MLLALTVLCVLSRRLFALGLVTRDKSQGHLTSETRFVLGCSHSTTSNCIGKRCRNFFCTSWPMQVRMAPHLTVGAVARIYAGDKPDAPTVQVLEQKMLTIFEDGGGAKRFMLIISDGTHHMQANANATDDLPSLKHALIKLSSYVVSEVGPTKVAVLIGVEVVAAGDAVGGVIGVPEKVTLQLAAEKQCAPAAVEKHRAAAAAAEASPAELELAAIEAAKANLWSQLDADEQLSQDDARSWWDCGAAGAPVDAVYPSARLPPVEYDGSSGGGGLLVLGDAKPSARFTRQSNARDDDCGPPGDGAGDGAAARGGERQPHYLDGLGGLDDYDDDDGDDELRSFLTSLWIAPRYIDALEAEEIDLALLRTANDDELSVLLEVRMSEQGLFLLVCRSMNSRVSSELSRKRYHPARRAKKSI